MISMTSLDLKWWQGYIWIVSLRKDQKNKREDKKRPKLAYLGRAYMLSFLCRGRQPAALSLFLFIFIGGCGLLQHKENQQQMTGGRTFYADVESVWRAAQLTLKHYPLNISDLDSGILETDFIKGAKVWVAPHKGAVTPPNGLRYKLRIIFSQVDVGGRVGTKVHIEKKVTLQRDFFSPLEPVASDGLEEEVILYRMGRELQIDKILEELPEEDSQ